MRLSFIFTFLVIVSCNSQSEQPIHHTTSQDTIPVRKDRIQEYYNLHSSVQGKSKAIGVVNNGSLVNGRLVPFSGTNFLYFDTTSYLNGRGFVHENLLSTLLQSYKTLEYSIPNRLFRIMECSNEHGGKIFPHRTHQNGLSVDFMTPLMKKGVPFYDLDTVGGTHYLLEFDDSGNSSRDPGIKIDFETMANHLLSLHESASKNGLRISKVIFKTELKDELFATESGKKLKAKNIYFTKSLTSAINALHDDHYHVDFELREP